MVESGGVEHQ